MTSFRCAWTRSQDGGGIKVSQVEINEIDPPPGVKAAMEREKSAAAIKTAEITESEGARQAAINRAEGEKQSAILTAEGSRQSEILNAEGDQQAAILRAEGFSTALERINAVAENADARTMSLQYFDTLRQMGQQPGDEVHLPNGVHEHAGVLHRLHNAAGQRSAELRVAGNLPGNPPIRPSPANGGRDILSHDS